MAIHTRKNLCQGVNPFFTSYAQNERDGWTSFHGQFCSTLTNAVASVLPPGYEAVFERSIQLRYSDPQDNLIIRRPEPDVTIWKTDKIMSQVFSQPGTVSASPAAIAPLSDTLESEENFLYAVVIREIGPDGRQQEPVTRIELLSPVNKDEGKGQGIYLAKREHALYSHTNLVEIDFLHETDSPIRSVPGYAGGSQDAYPYNISVSIPYPEVAAGKFIRYGYHVDDSLGVIEIPLRETETILVSLDRVYNTTFEANPAYYGRANYAVQPLKMETYQREDCFRIWGRMLAVLDAYFQGIDLENTQLQNLYFSGDPALEHLKQIPFERAILLADEKDAEIFWLVQHERLSLIQRQPYREIFTGTASQEAFARLEQLFYEKGKAALMNQIKSIR